MKYAQGIFGLSLNDTEINWETEKLVSHSQFSRWKTCPKSWELRYIRKKKEPSESIYLVYGTAMHNVLQTYIHTCYTLSAKKANEMNIERMFMDELKNEYIARVKSHGSHFSSKEQLAEYYSDGMAIINFIKKNRSKYFAIKGMKLMGIELPLKVSPDPSRPNIILNCHLDLVFYDVVLKKYIIIDIKTSKKGWNKWKKVDKKTTDQLVLYKKHFAEKFDIDQKSVEIVYFILKQKIDPDSLWPQKRVTEFSPSNGSMSLKRVGREFQMFLDDCFTKEGQYQDKSYPAKKGERDWNCNFCEYKDAHDLCPPEERIIGI